MATITLSSNHATDGYDMRTRDASAIISVVNLVTSTVHSPTQVTYTGGATTLVLNGTFPSYNAGGDPTAGTITSFTMTVVSGGANKVITVTDLSLLVTDFFALINSNSTSALNALIFGNDDTVTGSANKDTILGYGGNGQQGNDSYYVDNAADVTFEAQVGWGTDTVFASVNYELNVNLENLVLIGSALIGRGNDGANTLTGNAGANRLNGLGGNDTLIGDTGNDILIGGTGDDDFVFALGHGDDTINDFVAGGAEDSIDLSAYDGAGVTWTIDQVGGDTVFNFSNGDSITLLYVDSGDLIQDGLFGYS